LDHGRGISTAFRISVVLLDPYIPGKFGGAERVCAENGSKRKAASLLTHQR
jgi:hypothetical protein